MRISAEAIGLVFAGMARRIRIFRRHPAMLAVVLGLVLLVPLGRALRGSDISAGISAELGGERVFVARVIDGDTIRVVRGNKDVAVRLIGIDAPETNHPDKPVEPWGPQATAFVRQALEGKWVTLEYGEGPRRDRYQRTLAYVRLGDGSLFNEALVRLGHARAYTSFPFAYQDRFRAAEREAREAQRGLWSLTAAQPAGPVIGNRRSRVYHRPGQQHYDAVSPSNRIYFDSEEAAAAAGYRPARR